MSSDKPKEYYVLEATGMYVKTVDEQLYRAAQEEIEQLKAKLARYEEALKLAAEYHNRDDVNGEAGYIAWKTLKEDKNEK